MKATQRPAPDYPAVEAAIRRALRPLSVAQQQLLLAQTAREVSHD